jgi:hypothetical protein
MLKQGHVFKAWRDYIQRRDFDYTANVISLRFLETNKRYVMQHCFDALRHEKERLKQLIMEKALDGDMNQKLIGANAYLHDKSLVL